VGWEREWAVPRLQRNMACDGLLERLDLIDGGRVESAFGSDRTSLRCKATPVNSSRSAESERLSTAALRLLRRAIRASRIVWRSRSFTCQTRDQRAGHSV
jgi:hypothetical protein